MSKKIILLTVAVVVIATSIGLAMSKVMPRNEDGPPLTLRISTLSEVDYKVTHAPLKVTFENVSDKEVRVLKAFRDPLALRTFFRFSLKAGDGTSIPLLGGGKITLAPESYEYVVLKKGQKLDTIVDLAPFIPSGTDLKEGTYEISLVYFNQYGSDCFRGSLESNNIPVTLSRAE